MQTEVDSGAMCDLLTVQLCCPPSGIISASGFPELYLHTPMPKARLALERIGPMLRSLNQGETNEGFCNFPEIPRFWEILTVYQYC